MLSLLMRESLPGGPPARVESCTSSPRGLPACFPCRNSRRRRRRKRWRRLPARHPPPLCLRSISEKKGGCDSRTAENTPTSSVSTGLWQYQGLAGAAFGGNRLEYFWLERQCLCSWNPLELAWSSWGKPHLSPNADLVPTPPLLGSGSWCWERLVNGAVSSGFVPCLPASPSSLLEKACKIITERKLIQDINVSKCVKTLRTPSLRSGSCTG